MNNFDYKNMTPFKWFVLENFPFIENDFEAINNYRLFSKVVEYLNKTIDNMNLTGEQMENVTNAMTELQDYVNNYFENLDIQDEINNKLDEMATDGTLDNIINQEIFSQINSNITTLENNVNDLYALDRNTNLRTICIGDSYLRGSSNGSVVNSWGYYVKQYLNISDNNYEEYFESSSGILNHGVNGNTFLQLIQAQTISNPETVKRVIVAGGYNDKDYGLSAIQNGVSQMITYLKQTFVNAKIYFGCIGNNSGIGQLLIRRNIAREVLPAYRNCELYGATYLNGVEDITHDYVFCYNLEDNGDVIHPTQDGYQLIGRGIAEAIKTGNANYCSPDFNSKTLLPYGDRANVSGTLPTITTYIKNGIKTIMLSNINMTFDRSNLNLNANPGITVNLCSIPKNSNIRCVFDLLNNTQFKLNATNSDVEGETLDVIGSLCLRGASNQELLQLNAIKTPTNFPTNKFVSHQTTWSFPAFIS